MEDTKKVVGRFFAILTFSLLGMFGINGQTYSVKDVTLNSAITNSRTYKARDKIVLNTGFSFDATTGGKSFIGDIDESLQFEAEYSSTPSDVPSEFSIDHNLPLGAINGSFNVSPTGGAVYTIPIDIAPGTCGMQPELSAVYNSQSGYGLLGLGWNLSGVSSITRIGKNKYYDGDIGSVSLTNDDRLMLDGQRLMLISGSYGVNGSEYRLENDNYAKITAIGHVLGGAASYKIQLKGGNTLYYDKLYFVAGNTQPYVYLLGKMEDANGNYIIYNYDINQITKELSIRSIEYTGTTLFQPYNKVEFYYDKRSDSRFSYVCGHKIEHTLLLREVKVLSEGERVRSYEFEYFLKDNSSRLYKVHQYGINGERLNPTVISYGPLGNSVFDVRRDSLPRGYNIDAERRCSPWTYEVGDFNNDGISDILTLYNLDMTGSNYCFKLFLGDGSGKYKAESWFEKDLDYNKNVAISSIVRVVDMNDDGWDDIFICSARYNRNKEVSHNIGVYLRIPNDNGTKFNYYAFTNDALNDQNSDYRTIIELDIADLNNDGLKDIVVCLNMTKTLDAIDVFMITGYSNGLMTYNKKLLISDIEGGNNPPKFDLVDLNGNGKTDILLSVPGGDPSAVYVDEYIDGSFQTVKTLGYPTHWHKSYYGDFNGDGNIDLLTFVKSQSGPLWEIAINRGGAVLDRNAYPCPITSTATPDESGNYRYYAIDVNSDGLCDIIEFYKINHPVSVIQIRMNTYISTGKGFVMESVDIDTHYIEGGRKLRYGHFNKDQFIDILFSGANPASKNETYVIYTKPNCVESLVRRIENAEQYVDVTYKSCNYGSEVCTLSPSTMSSVAYKILPFTVVNYSKDNVNDGTTYKYEGPAFHLNGKGFIGFCKTVAISSKFETRTETNYGINNFYCKYLKNNMTFVGNAKLSENIYSHRFETPYSSNNKVFRDLLYKTDEFNYRDQGRKETSVAFDSYGNQTNIDTKIYEPSTYLLYQEINSSSSYVSGRSWIPCFPTKTTKTISRESSVTITNRLNYTYDSNGNVIAESAYFDGDNATPFDIVNQYSGHVCGLPNKTVVSTSSGTRTATVGYDSKYRFVVNNQNPAGHKCSFIYDGKNGNLLFETDEDNRTSKYVYNGLGRLNTIEISDGGVVSHDCGWSVNLSGGDVPIAPEGSLYYTKMAIAGGELTYTFYDKVGLELRVAIKQPVLSTYPWLYEDKTYDDNHNLVKEYLPYGSGISPTLFTEYEYYDSGFHANRVKKISFPDDRSTNYVYGALKTTKTTTAGDITKRVVETYDYFGKLAMVNDDGGFIVYKYNSHGEISSVSHKGDFILKYDQAGNRIELNDPSAGVIKSTYDSWGNMTASQSGQQVYDGTFYKMTYDNLDRLVSKKLIKGSFLSQSGTELEGYVYRYGTTNSVMGLYSEESKYGKMLYSYDSNGRLLSRKEQIKSIGTDANKNITFGYEYDGYGRLIKESFPNDVYVTNEYDYYGALISVNGMGGRAIYKTEGYSNHGSLNKYTLGRNLMVEKGFDANGRLTSILSSSSNKTYHSLLYGYGADGNISYRADCYHGANYDTREWFSYDVLSRLTGSKLTRPNILSSGVIPQSVYYDGNKISSKRGVGDYRYGDVPANAVIHINNVSNTLFNQNDCNITYTPFHKVESITEGDKTQQYYYGVDDNRIKGEYTDNGVKTTKYYGNGCNYEEIVTGDLTTYRYYLTGGDGVVAMYVKRSDNSTVRLYYLMKDHLGSVISVIEDDNNVYTLRERYSYDAWGRRRDDRFLDKYDVSTPQLTDRGFCGHEHLDGFNLINMTGRVYDPLLGVFLSPDPYVQSPNSTQGLNRYAYCMNNPIMYIDPDGEIAWIVPVVLGSIGGIINLAMNWSHVDNFGEGAAAFGAGFASGALMSFGFGGVFAGGAITGATNSIISQTSNSVGLKDIDWINVGLGAVVGSAVSGGSYGVARFMTNLNPNVYINAQKIYSPIVKGAVTASVTGAAVGGVGNYVSAYAMTGDANLAMEAAFNGAIMGGLTGIMVGGVGGYVSAKAANVNPWTGRSKYEPPATGQKHHLITRSIEKELDKHGTLSGEFNRNDAQFIYRARDEMSHRGYQKWHRSYDEIVIEWLISNKDATPKDFKVFLNKLHQEDWLKTRVPNVKIK